MADLNVQRVAIRFVNQILNKSVDVFLNQYKKPDIISSDHVAVEFCETTGENSENAATSENMHIRPGEDSSTGLIKPASSKSPAKSNRKASTKILNSKEILRKSASYRFSTNQRDIDFVKAAMRGELNFLRSELASGVDPNKQIKQLYVKPSKHTWFGRRHVKANDVDAEYGSAIFYAAKAGHARCVLLLLRSGAMVNLETNRGDTALHVAKSVKVADILVQYGADSKIKNAKEHTPLDTAVFDQRNEVTEYLRSGAGFVPCKLCGDAVPRTAKGKALVHNCPVPQAVYTSCMCFARLNETKMPAPIQFQIFKFCFRLQQDCI